ncbi:hypothetical protein U2F26_29615 [Micromonospora sp. 4G57]|uniref:Integral membrane protein n=1 Tax=Micromonospora sicca TaxID=2202420 RepID=A0ABU5JIJ9_9ACTN|nr:MULTISPECIES: hypothetical protein [unclassified Micromonospora]MDZ5446836.1 hypothetical protein [Micromonospora sp. 4G57]MDZ5492347.1 hypothetical protein [Micromonospora sp. 4G53]
MSEESPPPGRQYVPGEVVELRVHGVSGAGAEQVLDRPHVHQVAGDRSGGFFRPRPDYPDSTGPGGVVLEAYRWSDLPSGTAARTLSLVFLLPFMLSNVAIWMRPADRGSGSGVKVLCRLIALNLTLVYVLSAVGVALDLIAWKCMGSPRCLEGRAWLSWLGGRPVGLRLVVLVVLPVAALGLLWMLSVRPGRPYEAFRTPGGDPEGDRLSAVGQWDAMPMVGRLRAIHVAAAFAVLNLTLLAARGAGGPSPVVIVLAAVAGAVLAACLALLCAGASLERASTGPTDRLAATARVVACALTVPTLGVVALDGAPWPHSTGLPGYSQIVAWAFVAQMTLLFALAVLTLWRRRGRDPRQALLRGLGAPVIATAAVGLASALSAELVYRTAYFLNRRAITGSAGDLVPPPLAYKWAIFTFFLASIAAVAAGGAVTLLTRPGRRRAAAAIVARDFPDAPPEAADRLDRVARTIARARFTEWLGPLAMVFAGLAAVGLAASVLGLFEHQPGPLVERFLGVPAEFVNFGLTFGSYLIAGIIAGLVVGGLFAYRTAEFRRYVGVVWDLGTFWPRAAHPFAPPCYAERAVPELAKRICYLAGQHEGVLLTGHSHGSVLLAAAVLQLPAPVRRRVALLTYGSPLDRLYTRLFPAYLGRDVLREMGARIDWRWVNLWRDTDQIGGWVFAAHRPGDPPPGADPSERVDRRLRDPEDVVVPPSDSVPPPIRGHWPCESDERFAAAVRDLVGRLREADRGR